MIRLRISGGTAYQPPGCPWDGREFSALGPYERLHHLMTCGVYGVEPDKTAWWGYQIAAVLILLLMKFIGAGAIIGALGFWLMGRLNTKGQRSGAPYSIGEVLKRSKFPILYLRPFVSDQRRSGSTPFWPTKTPEAKMVSLLTKHLSCPMVAIADPREELGDMGALRVWLTADWRIKVTEFMRCAPIILRVGSSEGVLWELNQAVAIGDPTRLVIEVPEWSEQLLNTLRARLSNAHRYIITMAQIRNRRYIVFDPDWKPSFLRDENDLRLFIPQSYSPLALQPCSSGTVPPVAQAMPRRVNRVLLVAAVFVVVLVVAGVIGTYFSRGDRSCAGTALEPQTPEILTRVALIRDTQLKYLPLARRLDDASQGLSEAEKQLLAELIILGPPGIGGPKKLQEDASYVIEHLPSGSSDCEPFLALRRFWSTANGGTP